MTKLRAAFLAAAVAALAAPASASDHVLVVGKAATPLWHEARSSAASTAFSAAGLAELAMSCLGVPTGRLSSRPEAVETPLQADLFAHADAYALVLVDDASASVLETVDAALSATPAFHQAFPVAVDAADVKVPAAVAQEFRTAFADSPAVVRCAGSAALCASVGAMPPKASVTLVQEVLSGNSFLNSDDPMDMAFAEELAQVAQLAASLGGDAGKALYVVGLSDPTQLAAESKQRAVHEAAAASVTEFLAELMKTHDVVGAQVTTSRLPSAVQDVAALARRSRDRRLVAFLGDEEEEDEDLDEESGSDWEDDNVTTSSNSTSPMSMPDIAEYQILLWTSVLLGAVLLLAVLAMCNMDTGRDSLLYAKFIADVNHKVN
ncbi:hypothetical protein BBJ28_00000025 [Nothophytophthora sp. Chile5]|nr:hypothetical protein BBJ28_00000025 [Nothophytophthora sp. Chile5]